MGNYTTRQKLYRVDADEIVSAESNLNYNWRQLDDKVKHLVEWAPSEREFLFDGEDLSRGRKYLKRNSNSQWYAWDGGLFQDTTAFVNSWTVLSAFTASGWEEHTDPVWGRFMYTVDADGDVHLRGALRQTGGTAIPLKTTIVIATLPTAARPTQSRYFYKVCGNADAPDYSTCRVFIGIDGTMSIVRYGSTQGSVTDRYIPLTGINYPKDVGA